MTADEIFEYIEKDPNGVIAIDGELGAGKSTIANEIAERLAIPVVHVDFYLTPGKGCYVEALMFGSLERAILDAGLPVIVEGACLLDVLDKLHLYPELHFFIFRNGKSPYKANRAVVKEVDEYIRRTGAPTRSIRTLHMKDAETNQLDVDIAYLKYKTVVSMILSIGGISALVVGAYVMTSGINSQDSAVFKFLGAEVSAEGIGSVILASSVFWGYFAYLARPKYSRTKETRNTTGSDGSKSTYEFESSTMVVTAARKDG